MCDSILARRCCLGLLAVVVALGSAGVADDEQKAPANAVPPPLVKGRTLWPVEVKGDNQNSQPLDLSEFYPDGPVPHAILDLFSGRQIIDGLPFQIDGRIRLYGQYRSDAPKHPLPNSIKGIRISRKFDDLHLIHHAMWPDVEGQPIAYIRLNYIDGDEFLYAIRYGVHVSDWYFLPSYEKETVSDPNTNICWRRPPVQYKAPVRLFKTRLANPFPEKVVETMDVISARSLASYGLVAATVAQRLPRGPSAEAPRRFDGAITLRVVDDATGEPIHGALVMPGMNVEGEGVVAAPFYTSVTGEGTLRFPVKKTTNFWVTVKKEGYQSKSQSWGGGVLGSRMLSKRIPRMAEIRLVPGDENHSAPERHD